MAYECIVFEKPSDGVALVTLNRPRSLNALSRKLIEEFSQALDDIERNAGIHAIVVTGAARPDGRPCFSAGVDMRELADEGAGDPRSGKLVEMIRSVMDRGIESDLPGLCSRLENMSKPSIAAIDGVCTAGGLEVALACDIRLVSETALVSDLHIKNTGGIGGAGVSVRLARTVGPARAKEIMFTGDPMNGVEAVAIGLANHCYPPAKLLDSALGLAAKFAARRPEAIGMAKAAMAAAADLDLARALRYSYAARAALSSIDQYHAFSEKKPASSAQS